MISTKKRFVSISFLFLLVMGAVGNVAPHVKPQEGAQTLDLNILLRTRFDEYNAWLAGRLSLNGTTSDPFDYSRVSTGGTTNTSLSFPGYLISLAYMYEGTGNEFYLRQLQSYMDGAIADSLFYVDALGVGQIFTPPSWYWDNEDKDTGCIYPGIFGYIATKLYLWTGDVKYKAIADRIAYESYDKLAVIKNTTDVAWSWAYYHSRDEANAKIGVNRQTFMAWFYALYGQSINSTFTPFVDRIVNWVWRTQLADDSLAYSIGETITNPYYTAFSVTAALNSYLIDSSSLSTTLKGKIRNTIVWLNTQSNAQYDYQHLYFVVPALLLALKTDYFASSVSAIRAKSMLYVALNSIHLTDRGFIPRISYYSFGFRWQQLTVGTLFAAYPLADHTLDMNQFNPVTTYQTETGQYMINGWAGEIFATILRDGRDWYGSQIAHAAGRSLHFNPAGYQPPPTAVSITNDTYYIRVRSAYSTYTVDYYAYPVGVFVGDVTGTTTPSIVLDDNPLWRIRVANGSEWQLTALTSDDVYNFGTKMLLYLNDGNPVNRRSFFVKNNRTASWRYAFVSSTPRLYFSTSQTNYRVIYGEVGSFGHLIRDAATMYRVAESLVDAHDIVQPVDFATSFNAYHNKITELAPDATWKTLYQSAQLSSVKLVGQYLPEIISLTEWYSSGDVTAFTTSSSSPSTSITRLYVDKGEPKRVNASNGNPTWSYNFSTKILEIKVSHTGSSRIIVDWRLPGDVNSDGVVDILDVGKISASWHPGPPIGPLGYDLTADLNYDGAVDIADLAIVSAYWTGPPKGPLAP